MALPNAPSQLSISAIATEYSVTGNNVSLRDLSACASLTVPDAISEFYGLSAVSLEVTTYSMTNVTNSSMTIRGGITELGGAPSATRGFYFGTSPSIASRTKYTLPSSQSAVGTFTRSTPGLSSSTTYRNTAWAATGGVEVLAPNTCAQATCAPVSIPNSPWACLAPNLHPSRRHLGRGINLGICYPNSYIPSNVLASPTTTYTWEVNYPFNAATAFTITCHPTNPRQISLCMNPTCLGYPSPGPWPWTHPSDCGNPGNVRLKLTVTYDGVSSTACDSFCVACVGPNYTLSSLQTQWQVWDGAGSWSNIAPTQGYAGLCSEDWYYRANLRGCLQINHWGQFPPNSAFASWQCWCSFIMYQGHNEFTLTPSTYRTRNAHTARCAHSDSDRFICINTYTHAIQVPYAGSGPTCNGFIRACHQLARGVVNGTEVWQSPATGPLISGPSLNVTYFPNCLTFNRSNFPACTSPPPVAPPSGAPTSLTS